MGVLRGSFWGLGGKTTAQSKIGYGYSRNLKVGTQVQTRAVLQNVLYGDKIT